MQAIEGMSMPIQSKPGKFFRSQAAAGPVLAPRLLVAFGTHRERFQSATEVQQFYGIAPVIRQSGDTETVHIRTRCPKFGRQTFHELANCVLKCKSEAWARRYYKEVKKRNGGKHHAAVRALAFKLMRIYFACWKNRQPYDSKRYQKALKINGSPFREGPEGSSSSLCE